MTDAGLSGLLVCAGSHAGHTLIGHDAGGTPRQVSSAREHTNVQFRAPSVPHSCILGARGGTRSGGTSLVILLRSAAACFIDFIALQHFRTHHQRRYTVSHLQKLQQPAISGAPASQCPLLACESLRYVSETRTHLITLTVAAACGHAICSSGGRAAGLPLHWACL